MACIESAMTDFTEQLHFDDIKFIDNHMRNGLFKSGIIKDPLLIYQILQLPEYSIKA